MPTRIVGCLGISYFLSKGALPGKGPEPQKDEEQERRGLVFLDETGCLLIFRGCWGSSSPPKVLKTKISFESDVEDPLLRPSSSRRRYCLKATMTNAAEERQLWLKVATKVKHDAESKRKILVSP
jgi:hypothetical protein